MNDHPHVLGGITRIVHKHMDNKPYNGITNRILSEMCTIRNETTFLALVAEERHTLESYIPQTG